MSRLGHTLLAQVVTLGSSFASFYFVSPRLLELFGISQYAYSIDRFYLLLICVGCVLAGFAIGLFAFPLLLRPFVTSASFSDWMNSQRALNVPGIGSLFGRWCRFLFDKNS